MPDIVSTILAKALVMLLQALLTRVALYLIRTGMFQQLTTA
ncbi:hypothetical protein [Actinoallomurus sp. CA-150999]